MRARARCTDELAQPYGSLAPARWIGLNRKLSVIVNTDPAAYEGGDVQLHDRLGNPIAIDGIRERGTVLVFPSNLAHSVTPVTAGVRNSLTGWCLGPPLRGPRRPAGAKNFWPRRMMA
jgi:predicted 2-oxoglutarate/Fe(II)-dependent dioxygenase YbiX